MNSTPRTAIQESLIHAGVKNLRSFGYPSCNRQNIMTDMVFGRFFEDMLKENLGHSKAHDEAINGLLAELAKSPPSE